MRMTESEWCEFDLNKPTCVRAINNDKICNRCLTFHEKALFLQQYSCARTVTNPSACRHYHEQIHECNSTEIVVSTCCNPMMIANVICEPGLPRLKVDKMWYLVTFMFMWFFHSSPAFILILSVTPTCNLSQALSFCEIRPLWMCPLGYLPIVAPTTWPLWWEIAILCRIWLIWLSYAHNGSKDARCQQCKFQAPKPTAVGHCNLMWQLPQHMILLKGLVPSLGPQGHANCLKRMKTC